MFFYYDFLKFLTVFLCEDSAYFTVSNFQNSVLGCNVGSADTVGCSILSTLRPRGGVGSICHYPGPGATAKYYNVGLQVTVKDDFHL